MSATAFSVLVDPSVARADELRRYIDATLGWQAIDAATAAFVPPVVRFVGVSCRESSSVPAVLVVDEDDRPIDAAAAAARLQADAMVEWPAGRTELAGIVEGVHGRPRTHAPPRLLRVGGSAGGVGTTTTALAIGGLAAWRGLGTLVAVHARGWTPRVRDVAVAALASPDLFARAEPLAGVDRLRAVRVDATDHGVELSDPAIDVAVVDAGLSEDVDVLVVRPDRAGLERIGLSPAAGVVVMGDGPAGRRHLHTAAGGRRIVACPWSARVARAAMHDRVPAGLPGVWLRRLSPFVPAARP